MGDKRDTGAIDESYHFRGIGNQIVSSFMKLRVPGSIDGKEVSFSPSVTLGDIPPLVGNDHLIPWGCSIHLYPDECRLEIPSRGIDAKLHVTSSNHILVNFADFECMDEPDYDVWTSKRGRDSEETGTESDMTEETEETIIDPEEVPAKRSRRGAPRKPRVPRNHLQHTAEWARVSRAADKALALLLPDKGPRSMEISTVYTCQDTESECGTDNGLSEDLHRQRCEVKARRDAKMCCKILTAFGRREWKTWNDVPLELRKDIERIDRNLGHASVDQVEKLFRDAKCVR